MYRKADQRMGLVGVLGLVLFAGGLGLPAPAAAAAECSKTMTDPTGDAAIAPPFAPVAVADAPANTDITGVGFTYGRDGSGKPYLTVRVTIASLDRQVMTGFTRHRYMLLMTFVRPDGSDDHAMLEAIFDLNGAEAFHHGRLEDPSNGAGLLAVVRKGVLTGRFVEGVNGTIEMDVPVDVLKLDGSRVRMEGATASVETGQTADTEIPAPVVDQLAGLQVDYTESQFALHLAACATPLDVPAVVSPPAVEKALPRLASRRVRSVRGKVRIPLSCAAAAGCEAVVRAGARKLTVRMKPGARAVAALRLSRAHARRLKKGRRVKLVVRIGDGPRQRVTVLPR